MKFLASSWMIAILAALLNLGTTGGLLYLQRETIVPVAVADESAAQPHFWSFRADEVEALISELKSERAKLIQRQGELDKVAAHVEAEKQELEKTRADIGVLRDEMTTEIPQIQESERKNLKTLAQSYSDMTPAAAVGILAALDEMQAVKLLSLMKPDKVGAILQEMTQEQAKDETMIKRAARISDKLRLVKAEVKASPTP